jgi:outer membrane immunogenic protein
MRKTFLALTAAVTALLTSPVNAADLTSPIYKASPAIVAPVQDWSGFYLGINGGYGWGNGTYDTPFAATGVAITPLFAAPTSAGWVIGGHAGYNWQYGMVVGGLEVDYDAADITGSQTVTLGAGPASATLATKIDRLASARGRLGVAPMSGLLLYATAGLAYGHTESDISATNGRGFSASEKVFANSFGWVAGAGAEIKLVDHVVLGAEYLHYDLGEVSNQFALAPIVSFNSHVTADTVRARMSWRF